MGAEDPRGLFRAPAKGRLWLPQTCGDPDCTGETVPKRTVTWR